MTAYVPKPIFAILQFQLTPEEKRLREAGQQYRRWRRMGFGWVPTSEEELQRELDRLEYVAARVMARTTLQNNLFRK